MVAALSLASATPAAAAYVPGDEIRKSQQEFEESRFGIFIHWGIYSMVGHGEWVMQNENINYQEYPRLASGFCPSRFDAAEWAELFKASGARYVTFTSRHHDGFSMFKSEASPYNVVDATPFGRDVVGELASALADEGLKLHLYYSHLDWGRTDYYPLGRTGRGTGRPEGREGDWRHYMDFVNAQLTELLTNYGPIGAIWFDGVWDKDDRPREDGDTGLPTPTTRAPNSLLSTLCARRRRELTSCSTWVRVPTAPYRRKRRAGSGRWVPGSPSMGKAYTAPEPENMRETGA